MSFDPLTTIFEAGKLAIERIWPDPIRRSEELRKLEELRQQGNLAVLDSRVKLLLGQIEINKIEAQSKSLFVAGWRPAVGWVGVIALLMMYIPKAIVMTIFWVWQSYLLLHPVEGMIIPTLPNFPDLGTGDITGLLLSILGIGAMRSFDKTKNTETNSLGK